MMKSAEFTRQRWILKRLTPALGCWKREGELRGEDKIAAALPTRLGSPVAMVLPARLGSPEQVKATALLTMLG